MLNFALTFGYFNSFKSTSLTTTVESNYISVNIYCLFYKQMVLEWSIPTTWGSCKFEVYKAETEYGPWLKLTPTPIAGNFFKDTTTMSFSKFSSNFYKVECILPSGQRLQSRFITWENKRSTQAEIRANEIQRRETLLLTKFTGVRSLVFRRRHFGTRCRNCWNTEIEKVTKDHCEVCLGTSFEGGYYPGFETLIQYEPTQNNTQLSYQGRVEPNVIPAWTTRYPEIDVFDVVIRIPDWRAYKVEAVQNTELQTVTVRQMLQLNELDKESIELKLANQAIPREYILDVVLLENRLGRLLDENGNYLVN